MAPKWIKVATEFGKIEGLIDTLVRDALPSKYEERTALRLAEAIYDGFPLTRLSYLALHETNGIARILSAVCFKIGGNFSELIEVCKWMLVHPDPDVRKRIVAAYSQVVADLDDQTIVTVANLVNDSNESVSESALKFVGLLNPNVRARLRI